MIGQPYTNTNLKNKTIIYYTITVVCYPHIKHGKSTNPYYIAFVS